MHSFLWSGRDAKGLKRSERVTAENAQAAKAVLLEQGWTNLTLVQDEIGDIVKQYVVQPEGAACQPESSPDEDARRLRKDKTQFFHDWGKAVVEAKGTFALLGIVMLYGFYNHRVLSVYLGGAGVIGMFLLYPAIRFYFGKGATLYQQLNRAKVWGRWDEVLACVEKLRQFRQRSRMGITDAELARNRAQALAAKGQLAAALAEYEPYAELPTVPRWMQLSQLAGIYDCGRQFEMALQLRRQMTVEKADTAVTWIDLAYGTVRWMNQPTEAREALARAEALEIPELGKPYVPYIRGMILWREGKPAEALPLFQEAKLGFLAHINKPLVEGNYLLISAYLCAIHSALGNQAEARKLFSEVEKFLVAHQEDELLAACQPKLARAA